MTSKAMLWVMGVMASRSINGEDVSFTRLTSSKIRHKQQGFAYVLLLIVIAVIGIVAGNSVSLGSQISRRDAEQSLLAIGGEFELALRSYAGIGSAVNAPNARGPRALEDLLKDPRSVSVRRHLRQFYADPLTGKAEWGLVKDPSGGIVGVYSLANGTPIKRSSFEVRQAHFEEANSYRSWIFGLPEAQRIAATTVSGFNISLPTTNTPSNTLR